MQFVEKWRLLPVPDLSQERPMPGYGWGGLLVVLAAQILLFWQIEPVYTNATPIHWIGYIAFIDAWTFKRAGRSFFHPSQIRTAHGKRILKVMLPASVVWWLLFEFVNCYLENWHYIGMPDNPSRYLGYLISFATIFPGILCTAEWLLTFRFFQDRGIMKSFDIWSRLEVSVGVPLLKDRRQPIPLKQRFLIGSLICGALAVAIPQLLPWREVRWHLFAPVWVGYIFLVEPVLYWAGAPSLFRAWEMRRVRAIAAYLFAGVVCGLLWEYWNYWAGAKWLYTVPFTETIRYFEMPVLGFLGFIPFAWECYALFSLSLLVCGSIEAEPSEKERISPSGRRNAGLLCGGIALLCVVTYLVQPKEYFRIEHVFSAMPKEGAEEPIWGKVQPRDAN